MRGRDVLAFIDNASAKDSLVKADSPHPTTSALAVSARLACAHLMIGLWMERVPSCANIADWPSRNLLTPLAALGAKRCYFVVPQCLRSTCVLEEFETRVVS